MPITLNGTTGITAPSYGGTIPAEYSVPVTAFKNRIINGAMQIDQRNAGASVTPAIGNTYSVDRWYNGQNQSSKLTVQQNAGSVTPPAGFSNYLGITSTSAYSVLSSDFFTVDQRIEGFNISDFAWGTASASTVTLSFWVRSSLTGTFGGSLTNNGSISYAFTYTISAANTWEQKTITITGPTTGTWLTNNGIGLFLRFGLGVGSSNSTATTGSWISGNWTSATGATSVVGTNGATFYITGVQLEKGSTATSFDYRPYGTELALCQRYYETVGFKGACANVSGTLIYGFTPFSVHKRTTPTTTYTGTVTLQGFVSGLTASVWEETTTGNGWSLNRTATAGTGYMAGGGTINSSAEL
jgi:hypothetical protein